MNPAPVDADRAAAAAAAADMSEPEPTQTPQPADGGEPAREATESGESPPAEQEGTHLTTLQALERVKHLFGRKRE